VAGTVALIRGQLREAILSGELSPGEVATQADLADRFKVSRTPLREALRMLELEGLVLRGSNGRFRISPLSVDQIEELAVMRINLEAAAVNITVPQFGHVEHAKLEGLLAQIERYATVADWVGIEVPHREFHRMLVSGAGNWVTDLLAKLWDHATRYRTVAFERVAANAEGWEAAHAEHRAIVKAFEAHDAEAAAGWIAAHIARSALLVAQEIDPGHPVQRVHDSLERYTGTTTVPGVNGNSGRALDR
jgi:DNA-binding GntR family transcriptional regulator